jgi:hypothetical protein
MKLRAVVVLGLAVACALAASPGDVRSQSLLKSLFFRLPGSWSGEGNVGGLPAKVEMTWSPAFDGRFMRVTWLNLMTGKDGNTLRFEGEGTYEPVPNEMGVHAGTWYDSQGTSHPLSGRVAGDSLITEWGPPGAPVGRTTYRLLESGTLSVHDEIQRNGTWYTFGRTSFRKNAAAAAR